MFGQWINAIDVPIPDWLHWIGLCATLLGTLIAMASALLALYSARRAQSASASAALAAAAARRLGRVTQLGDLILDMQELQAMILSEYDLIAVAAKCDRLRGRVVRFKSEAEAELTGNEREELDKCREQLASMSKAATNTQIKDENRPRRLQLAFGNANEALNRVVALHQTVREERKS